MGRMKEHEISPREIAEQIGYTNSALWKILNGQTKCYLGFMEFMTDYINKKSGKTYTLNDLFG